MGIPEIFGSNVFSLAVMKERLPKNVYTEFVYVQENGGMLPSATADAIAEAMKNWAVEKGATHYTHWFQPLTGATAEKHDSFLTVPNEMGYTLLQLSGKKLIMGEPDASSFPSGGLRGTSYARGYTAWDITSPAFVKEQSCGTILCIPTVFVSYTGEALDAKTPLLRSMQAVSREAIRLVRLFGNTTAKKVAAYVGPEQEYFLVDRNKYLQRRDLIYANRTLFGAPAPKGQELDDHYFGAIRERVGAFMADLNVELWKYGITATTQHNEVAPAQHELAPIFSTANVAVDQNNLTMETMKRVAERHNLVCLLHEKPYAGVNGSGKHNNWSLGTDDGENLFEPGDKPEENLQFQLVLACVMRAVDKHADLLRESASDVGNDHRLGAQEAPPAIISIFLGDQLESLVNQIVGGDGELSTNEGGELDTGVSTVPVLKKAATDRNRTSPFAFTGNRFEFRMVGSRDNIAGPNTALNAVMAEAFADAADALEGAEDFEEACKAYIKKTMTDHQRIIFNGDGYSEEWVEEAARRGLPNIKCMVDAIPVLTHEDVVELFERFHIFTRVELESRAEISYENYAKQIGIEAKTMIHLAGKRYIPAIINCTTELAQSVATVEAVGCDASVQRARLEQITGYLKQAEAALENLTKVYHETDSLTCIGCMAKDYRYKVIPAMDALRAPIDAVELLVNKDSWPVPTYGDLMFEV
ncbi:MAG: glutamine synthetase III [Clostridiales bacterium]|nr:glutamine synthetase III [Clostridiales bacterium]